jgi:uncharacterized protein (DUF1800 family)
VSSLLLVKLSTMPATPPVPPSAASSAKPRLSPVEAWQPLPSVEWDLDAARHLLRRAGWTARPADVARAHKEGLVATLDRLFPAKAVPFPPPPALDALYDRMTDARMQANNAAPGAARPAQAVLNQDFQQAEQELVVGWLDFASRPENSVQEKWILFLGDIYVISQEKVRNPQLVHAHQALLREHGYGLAPALTKAVSRSPAMVQFLDLGQSQRGAPNENFARELFELFTLGEGNYTERDIKEAARAFTGYRQQEGEFFFAPRQHDPGSKNVLGRTGNFDGDAVIDLAYAKPAAGAFMPRELVKFYLADDPLPKEHLAALGDWWRTTARYDLRKLAQRFFGSRLFFDPAYRGGFIKSPVQFLLGLHQDLSLDFMPVPRRAAGPLRQMGQIPFRPPNVRGWVGGRNWINSSTLAARRQAVELLFNVPNEANFNADERDAIEAARKEGRGNFSFDEARFASLLELSAAELTDQLLATLLPVKVDEDYRGIIRDFLAATGPLDDTAPPPGRRGAARGARAGQRAGGPRGGVLAQRVNRLRNALVTILQSPEYQLC